MRFPTEGRGFSNIFCFKLSFQHVSNVDEKKYHIVLTISKILIYKDILVWASMNPCDYVCFNLL